MKFTTAFNTLALSFAVATGSADARIGQHLSSTDAFESRMLSGTQDCDYVSFVGRECDPSSATACGAQNPQCDYACVYTDNTGVGPAYSYRCEKQDGRKLGGDPTSTPGSANARIGQQMSTDAFESRMLSGTQDCDDSSGCCAGQECDPSSATACGAQNPQCDDYACVLTDNTGVGPAFSYRCGSRDGRKLGGDPTSTPGSANARIGQQMSSTDAFESRMLSGTQDCDYVSFVGRECDPSSATACGAQNPQCDYACVYTENTGVGPAYSYRCE